MRLTVLAPFYQLAAAGQRHPSRRQRRGRRWATAAATCLSVLRAATFTLKLDGSVDIAYLVDNGGGGKPEDFHGKATHSKVEFWWSLRPEDNDGAFRISRTYSEGARLEACVVKVRGITIDLFNGAVEGFKLRGKREPTAGLEAIARDICSRSNNEDASKNIRVYLPVDNVLDVQALVLNGHVWKKESGQDVIEFTHWNIGSSGDIPANEPLFRRVAAVMLQRLPSLSPTKPVCKFVRPKPMSTNWVNDLVKLMCLSPKEVSDIHEYVAAWPLDGFAQMSHRPPEKDAIEDASLVTESTQAVMGASRSSVQIVWRPPPSPSALERQVPIETVFAPDFPGLGESHDKAKTGGLQLRRLFRKHADKDDASDSCAFSGDTPTSGDTSILSHFYQGEFAWAIGAKPSRFSHLLSKMKAKAVLLESRSDKSCKKHWPRIKLSPLSAESDC